MFPATIRTNYFSHTTLRTTSLPTHHPHPGFGPAARAAHNFDPMSGDPFTTAVIVAGVPDFFIGRRNPFFSHSPVSPMSAVFRRGITVTGLKDSRRLMMTMRIGLVMIVIKKRTSQNNGADTDGDALPSMALFGTCPDRWYQKGNK